MDEILSFEDVMIRLRLTSVELQRLITTGRLATSFVDGRMVFNAGDVEKYKRSLTAPPPAPAAPPPGPTPQAEIIAARKPKKPAKKPKKAAKKKKKR